MKLKNELACNNREVSMPFLVAPRAIFIMQARHFINVVIISMLLPLTFFAGMSTSFGAERSEKKCITGERKGGMLFLLDFQRLKEGRRWDEIINLATKELSVNLSLDENDKALIKCRMASTYFYLGNYNMCMRSSLEAYEHAKKTKSCNLKVRALYLISASFRAKGVYSKSKQYISKALSLIQDGECRVCNQYRAKVYFNAAALEHDLADGDKDIIWQYYSKAASLLVGRANEKESLDRIKIRQGRYLLEAKGPHVAEKYLADLGYIDMDTRTGVHAYLLKIRIYSALKKSAEAIAAANVALVTAKRLQMKKELRYIQDALKSIGQEGMDPGLSQKDERSGIAK